MNAPLTTPPRAPMTRRDPFGLLFDDFLDDAWMRPEWRMTRLADMPSVARARMDVVDKGNAFEITVDLPGVKKEDINVSVDGDRVAIRAEMKSEKEVKEGDKVLHTERMATTYARSFELPAEVTDVGADARYENGVLVLMLPKRAPTASRKLTVS
jgi:HSP20 family protein